MDKNLSLERRFSLNSTNIPSPIAESTCVNFNGSSSTTHFPWGGTPISPKNRSNSSICINSSSNPTPNTSKNSSRNMMNNSSQRGRINISKIDPRIYADVQSKGLVSRIVKYHENGSRLNRSMSASNLYNKPGQFPVVHLKKNELPYKATKQNLSMTRIAPPEKSMFYGNTVSSLLRSNSVIGLQKSDEEISHENRPILHPPTTEGDMAPTRSVLDVLKEISRKRINSDELELNDTTKKYCNRDNSNDNVDVPQHLSQLQQQQQIKNINMNATQSYKRQREQHIPHHQYNLPNSSGYHQQNFTPLNKNSLHQSAIPSSSSNHTPILQQHSPEQLAKRRLYSYNNDITSSLSSSLIHTNKRKYYEQKHSEKSSASFGATKNILAGAHHRSCSIGGEKTDDNSGEVASLHHKSKMHCQQKGESSQQHQHPSSLHFQQISKALSCTTPITPIPATPIGAPNSLSPSTSISAAAPTSTLLPSVLVPTSSSSFIAQAQRTSSEPLLRPDHASANGPLQTTNKPKLTLFNKNYNVESSETKQATNNALNAAAAATEDEDGDYAGIQFVKPKKSASIPLAKNPLIERTQKSKLALMLSGLRGELYNHGEAEEEERKEHKKEKENQRQKQEQELLNDDIDASKQKEINSQQMGNSKNILTTTKLPIIGNKDPTPGQIISTTSATLTSDDSVAATTTAALTPANPVAAAATTTTAVTAGAFKFTPAPLSSTAASEATTSAASPSTIIAPTATTTKTSSPLVGLKLAPQKSALPAPALIQQQSSSPITTTIATTATSQAAPTFSFGLSNTNAAAAAAATTKNPIPVLGGFSFGMNSNNNSNTVTTNATVTTGATPGFGSFGTITTTANAPVTTLAESGGGMGIVFGVNKTANPSTANTAAAKTAPPPAFSFGAIAAGAASAAVTQTKPTISAPPPSFGSLTASSTTNFSLPVNTTTTSTANSDTIKSSFGFGAPATTSTTSASGFSFGTSSALKPTTDAPAPFSFGAAQPVVSSVPAAASGGFSFSNNNSTAQAPPTTISNTFSFGSTGGSAPASSTNFQPAAAKNLFGFNNTPVSTTAVAFGSGFGASNNTQASATPSPAFGSNQTAVADPAKSAPTFSFGSRTENTATNSGSGAGGFSFGASATPSSSNTSTTNLFGSSISASTTNTGIVKPSFSFGGAAGGGDASATTADAAKSLFGGINNTTPASNNSSTFGSLTTAAAASNSNNKQNKAFSFGTQNTAPAAQTAVNTNNNNNIFGAKPSNSASAGGGMLFGGQINAAQNKLPAAGTASGGFSFGGRSGNSANATNQQAVAPFSFGGSNTTTPAAPQIDANKTFTFGVNVNNNHNAAATAANIFGAALNSTAGVGGASNVPSFAFSAGNPSTAAAAPLANGSNLFAPQAQTSSSSSDPTRLIRRATRRLQKS